MKRLVCLLLCMAMISSFTVLVGCGEKEEPVVNNNNNAGVSVDSEEEFFLDVPAELRGTVVQVATWGSNNDFNKHRCILILHLIRELRLNLLRCLRQIT
ncbi:MAG: hypothetical protein U0M42_09615 [Acutalibacteraceae bacterium]|nr:hypothetical protein [Acutalibacteraceae bacterium]